MRLRHFITAGIVAGAVVSASPAQDQLIRQQEKLQTVAMQKVEISIQSALAEAQKLQAAGSNVRAAERLRQAMRLLDDPVLPKKKTDEWRAQLTDALRLAEAGKRPEITVKSANPLKASEVERRKAWLIEDEAIRRSIDTIGALYKAGAISQAQKEMDAIAGKYPTNPTVIAMPGLLTKTKTIEEIRLIHAQQAESYRLAALELDRMSIVPKKDLEFDEKRFKEITELRKPKLDPVMKSMLTSLKTPVEFDFKNMTLMEALKQASAALKQPITLDKQTMTEAGIDASTAANYQTPAAIQGRTALKSLLGNYGLTYIVKDGRIQVVTREKAAQTMETRVYYLGDLVTGTGAIPGGSPRLGPVIDQMQAQQNVQEIVNMLKNSVDPNSWKGSGGDGKGEITFHAPSMALVVKASAEVHGMLAGTLGSR
ncbi:hypothetical protein [Zavarzinella formosa]|uniref:hypothetical protein n=1 Tax=Zavarzinella formosa TaxID=360055 RepID=UPI0002FE80F6|nr:hypothetical protein [Zavarzinella formosa]